MLPEVRAAMDAASRQYVHLDELAEAVGTRLAALTGAEWGLVTSGCSAALTHATAACDLDMGEYLSARWTARRR